MRVTDKSLGGKCEVNKKGRGNEDCLAITMHY